MSIITIESLTKITKNILKDFDGKLLQLQVVMGKLQQPVSLQIFITEKSFNHY